MKQLVTLEDLGPRCRQVLEYIFEHPRADVKEIGKALGMSISRVYQIRKHPKFQAMFPEMARRKVKGLIPKAVDKLERLLEQSDNLEVSRKVTESVLGSQKVLENQPQTQINVFQTMSIDDLKRKLDDIRTTPSDVVDTDVISTGPSDGTELST